ncbi:MAG: septal ring lytic transglycosylase RlpA family protein [Alphaproteobacteria bacterium]
MKTPPFTRFLAPLTLCLLLAACATHPSGSGGSVGGSAAPSEGTGTAIYKVGTPYQIGGEWYYPREDYSYDETGVASWYGADFHEHRTANGEIFNKDELTAAHKTLPLPTLARVTNLDNGKSIVVRINDRGPFSSGRIIDMSQRAAQLLGFENQGTAKVRVQVLSDESKAIADAMRHYGGTSAIVAASAAPEQMASAAPQSVQTETLEPIRTTPETHSQLLQTQPVAEVVQLPVTTHNQLFIQAGAFTVPENATRLQQNLARVGTTTISTIVINGTKFYRVRVGPAADVPHADALLAKVKQAGATAARTVVD